MAAPFVREAEWGGAVRVRRPQKRLDRRLEEVTKAIGGGYCRLQMPFFLSWHLPSGRQGLGVGWGHWRGGGGPPPLPMHPWSAVAQQITPAMMRLVAGDADGLRLWQAWQEVPHNHQAPDTVQQHKCWWGMVDTHLRRR